MESQTQPMRPNLVFAVIGFAILFGLALAGARALQSPDDPTAARSSASQAAPSLAVQGAVPPPAGFATRTPGGALITPTPDVPHPLPSERTQVELYTVQAGDSLGTIAQYYGVSLEQLVQANNLLNPDYVEPGQVLTIPIPSADSVGPSFKIVPDSELVYSPSSIGFDVAGFIQAQGGYLSSYKEEIGDQKWSGAKIVQRVVQDYSVNPRLLLAVLEYQSRWVTQPNPSDDSLEYPIGLRNQRWKGLYRQMIWAANQLNRGYYLWRLGGSRTWLLGDGSQVPISPVINAGTAGLQNMFAPLYDRAGWEQAVSEAGLQATYQALFGYPFDYTYDPLLPADLQQPAMQLPFEMEKTWSFTGGPHGGWGDGSAWAGLDFAPPGEALGCVLSDEWVAAVADGVVTRTGDGIVIQDLDGDGYEQTGWVVLYLHIDSQERVEPGVYLKAGERIGHPSCEGGVSNGTHVHLARRFNGEWIPADQTLPFNLDGWISSSTGKEYDGYLQKDGASIEAYEGRDAINQIQR
jgi:LasA protease